MKLVGVMDEDPFDPRTWSGLSKYFFESLNARGVLHTAVAALPSPAVRRLYQALSYQPDMARWRFKYHLNVGYYGAMTRTAERALKRLPQSAYDVVLQVGAWYDMPGTTRKPVVSYHDGNLAALLKSPYGYPKIAAAYIRNTLEYERDLYRRMTRIFPMSEWLAGSFIADYGVDQAKVFPVGAGINLPRLRDVASKDYNQHRILFVGKDFRRKGGPELLEAFRKVRAEVRDAELTIIGPRLDSPPPGVRCLGLLSKANEQDMDKLLDEYARASLFVLPSLYEPFGVVFGEAMAHRCPCIGTNICAMPEIIAHGQTGYVVPPGNADSLAHYMLMLLKEPEMSREFGNRGYEKYQANLTWDAVTKKICDSIALHQRM